MNPYASAITLILPAPSSPKQTQIFVSKESRLSCCIILGAQLDTRYSRYSRQPTRVGWDGAGCEVQEEGDIHMSDSLRPHGL